MAYGKTKPKGKGYVSGPVSRQKQGAMRRPSQGPKRPGGMGPDTLPGGPGFESGGGRFPMGMDRGVKNGMPYRDGPRPLPPGLGQQQPGRFFQNRLEEAGLRLGQGGGIKAPGVAGAQNWNPEQIALMQKAYDRFGISKNPAFDPSRTTYTGNFYDVPGGAMPQFISNTGYLSGGTNGQSFRPDMLPGAAPAPAPAPSPFDSVIDPREFQGGFGGPLVNPRQPRSLLDLLG